MTCNDVLAKLEEHYVGLAPEIASHLNSCSSCEAEYRKLVRLTSVLGTIPQEIKRTAVKFNTRYFAKVAALLITISLFVLLPLYDRAYATPEANDVIISSPTIFYPNAPSGLSVIAIKSFSPSRFTTCPEQKVKVELNGITVFDDKTDKNGSANVRFNVPDLKEGEYVLLVRVNDKAYATKVKVKKEIRVLLTTDKPMYQPTQTIKFRALALDSATLKPVANNEATFEVEDAKGNKVFKSNRTTSEFGIAHAEFQLADEIIMGHYRIYCNIGKFSTIKSVEVKKYTLPKFKVNIETDKNYYKPSSKIKGKIDGHYFFGKPVSDSTCTVKTEIFGNKMELNLKTDKDGKCDFELDVPQGEARKLIDIHLEAEIKDKTEHIESSFKSIIITENPITLNLLPEGGRLVPGLDNNLFVIASYPDGSTANFDVDLEIQRLKNPNKNYRDDEKIDPSEFETLYKSLIKTNETGYQTIKFPAKFEYIKGAGQEKARQKKLDELKKNGWFEDIQNEEDDDTKDDFSYYIEVSAKAKDSQGNSITKIFRLPVDVQSEALIVTLDKAIYKHGDKMTINLFSGNTIDTAFVEISKNNQRYLSTTCRISNSRGTLELSPPQDLFGVIKVSATLLSWGGEAVKDFRLCYVDSKGGLDIKVATDKDVYKPADNATLTFNIGKYSALSVAVVDEAVLALADQRPGLEKLFFTVERQITRYKLRNQTAEDLLVNTDSKRNEVLKMIFAKISQKAKKDNDDEPRKFRGDRLKKVQRDIYNENREIDKGWSINTLEAKTEIMTVLKHAVAKALEKVLQENLQNPSKVLSNGKINIDTVENLVLAKLPDIWKSDYGKENVNCAFDPWGRTITLKNVVNLEAFLDYFTANHSSDFHSLATEITYFAADRDFVKQVNGKWEYTDKLRKLVSGYEDCWGNKVTLEWLVSKNKNYTPDELAKATYNFRKNELFKRLIEGESTNNIINPYTGKPFDVNELGKAEKEFSRENIDKFLNAKKINDGLDGLVKDPSKYKDEIKSNPQLYTWVIFSQFHRLYNKIEKYCKDNKKYLYKDSIAPDESILDEIVEKGIITDSERKDIFGNKIKVTSSKTVVLSCCEGEKETGCRGRFVNMISAGPDGKFGTSDDTSYAGSQYQGNHYSGEIPGPQRVEPNGLVYNFNVSLGIHIPYNDILKIQEHATNVDKNDEWEKSGGGGSSRYSKFAKDRKGRLELIEKSLKDIEKKQYAMKQLLRKIDDPKDRALSHSNPNRESGQEEAAIEFIREWFPETLYFNPELVTDNKGKAKIDLKLADSITSWRILASANTKDGMLGFALKNLTVFKDFFVDIDAPVFLIQNDEITLPIGVYNYLKEKQKVRLVIEKADWFDIIGENEKRIEPLPNGGISVAYFKIKAKHVGRHKVTVKAFGTKLSDALAREIEVMPDGRRIESVINGIIEEKQSHTLNIPKDSVDGAHKILVKIYPSVFSQIQDGLDGMLKMPYG